MLIHRELIYSGRGSIVVVMLRGDRGAKTVFFFFFFFGWFGSGRSPVMRVSCAPDSENNHLPPPPLNPPLSASPSTRCPVTVGGVFLADVLDRAAHAGSITRRSW